MKEYRPVHELLQLKAEQVRSGAEILLEKTRDWQVIKEFMNNRMGDIMLTPVQEKKLNRYKYIYDQLSSGRYTKNQVISQLMNEKIFGISMSQAYEDIRCCTELFSFVTAPKKQFELNIQLEIAKNAQAKCMEIFDFKSAAAFGKVIKDLVAMLPDEDDVPGQDFEGHTLEGVFDPRLLGGPAVDMMEVLKTINAKRKVPINLDLFEHLNFEETTNEKADPL